jgi:hypothetical protein
VISFDLINYSVRPNKNVERKLIFETALHVAKAFPLREYRYIGFGAIWFVDFVLAHKVLKIFDLVSIEKEGSRRDRIEFNKPFKCIKVEIGSSTSILPTLGLDKKRAMLWLDYDGPLDESVLEDVRLVAERCLSGSLLIVSVNASRRAFETCSEEGQAREPIDALRETAGDLVPLPVPAEYQSAMGFPNLIGEVLSRKIQHSLHRSGRGLNYLPLFNYRYADGVPMVTVGGMIADESDANALRTRTEAFGLPFVTKKGLYEIDVPHLTPREKAAFDALLPTGVRIGPRELKFTLRESQIKAYRELYTFYPVFGEIVG